MQKPKNPQRRHFLKVLGGASASLSLGIQLSACSENLYEPVDENRQSFEPNAWITIYPSNKIEIAITKSEMGQNILSTFLIIVAEELNTDPEMITPKLVSPARAYGSMYTGGSSSVRSIWMPLRQAAATARSILQQSAAKAWHINMQECLVKDGQAINRSNNETMSFGELCHIAKQLPMPTHAPLKSVDSMRFLGKKSSTIAVSDKVTGKTSYGIDTNPPQLTFAAIKHAPVFGSTLASCSLSDTLKQHKSLLAVVKLERAVAIIATSYWRASSILEQAEISWTLPEGTPPNTNEIRKRTMAALDQAKQAGFNLGASQTSILSPVYENSYQAHVTMEPMNCTVHIHENGTDIWIPTQDATHVHSTAAKHLRNRLELMAYKALKKLGVEDDIRVHPTICGGGFGRRLEVDYLVEALDIATHVSQPVKVTWSREEDIQHDFYRPFSLHQLSAHVNKQGEIQNLTHVAAGANKRKVTANIDKLAYSIPNLESFFGEYDPGVPTGYWRSVAYSNHIFATESFLDQVASETGQSPFKIRENLLRKNPRALKILERAQQVADQSQDSNKFSGIALLSAFGSYIATVVTLNKSPNHHTIENIYCAADCGFALDPDNVRAQLEGGIIFGLNAAIKHAIHINEGRVQEHNFNDYPLLSLAECPPINIDIVSSGESPGGAGELSVPVVAPALANALFNKTGNRPTRTPFKLT